jgi:hypothetical protein
MANTMTRMKTAATRNDCALSLLSLSLLSLIVGVRIPTSCDYHGMRMVGPDTLIALAPGMIFLGLSAHDGIATA